jgi:hypothetical protein
MRGLIARLVVGVLCVTCVGACADRQVRLKRAIEKERQKAPQDPEKGIAFWTNEAARTRAHMQTLKDPKEVAFYKLLEQAEKAEADACRRRLEEARGKAQRDAGAFAEKHLPELQKALTRVDEEVRLRQRNLDKMREIIKGQGLDPDKDVHCQKRAQTIAEMRKLGDELKAARRDAYIAYKKVELISETGDARGELEKVIEQARKSAREALKNFDTMLAEPGGRRK